MSLSISLAIFGYALLAVVTILDKFIVTNEKIKPIVVTFYSTAPLLLILLALPFNIIFLRNNFDWFIVLISGATFMFGLWSMYAAFAESEVSHSGPLVGAATPFFTLIIGYWLATEVITHSQLLGIVVLIIGSLLISLQRGRHQQVWTRATLYALIAGLCYAVSNITAKYLYTKYGFYSGFVWTRGAAGLCGIALLLSASVRSALSRQPKPLIKKHSSHAKATTVIVDKIMSLAGVVLVQYAIALGSVTIVNALVGVEYAVLILSVAVLSKFVPKLFKEKYERGESLQEAVAVIIIAVGLIFIIH